MSAALGPITDPRLDALFALRTPLLKALKRAGATHDVQHIADMILRGVLQFFGDERGACITEVIQYPRRKVLNVFLTFGELNACLALQPEMESFALAQGCTALVATGREGWLPALEKQGFRRFGFVYAKELV